MALNFGCYMIIEIIKLVHDKNVLAKMTMHIGFVNLSMAVTTYSNISSSVTEAEMTVKSEIIYLYDCRSVTIVLQPLPFFPEFYFIFQFLIIKNGTNKKSVGKLVKR